MSKIKHTVPVAEVFHLWANEAYKGTGEDWAGTKEATSTFGGHRVEPYVSVQFREGVVYSFKTVIGRILYNAEGEKSFIVNTANYSSRTGRHYTELHRAITGLNIPIFSVEAEQPEYGYGDGLPQTVEGLLGTLARNFFAKVASGYKARESGYRWYFLNDAQQIIDTIYGFCKFFSIGIPDTIASFDRDTLNTDASNAHIARMEAAQKRDAKSDARFEKAKQEALQAEALTPQVVEEWRNHKRSSIVYPFTMYLNGDLLRVSKDGKTVESNRTARAPIEDVRRAKPYILALIHKAQTEGKPQIPAVPINLGYYRFHVVEEDGTVRVGCHRFAAQEILNIANAI